jgi:VWFA-related protein
MTTPGHNSASIKRRCLIASAALTCLGLALAQSVPPGEIHSRTVACLPPSGVTLRAEVRVVEVPVVIRDAYLHAFAGLKRDDFEIYDDGKQQTITSFSMQQSSRAESAVESTAGPTQKNPPRPRFLALCFDNLHLLPALLKPVKEAAKRFVKTSLAPGDQVVVVRTSKSEDVKFTNDVPVLVEHIDKVTASIVATAGDTARCPHIEPHEAYQIANHVDPGNHLLQTKMDSWIAAASSSRASVANWSWILRISLSSNSLRPASSPH